MMAQYWDIKKAHPDCLLFYRMGDFYELFFEDAVTAAAALDITLTKRGKHKGEDVAMCGVPFHAVNAYLSRLIRRGFKVAICEQVEDPAEARKRGGKAVVRREVVRIVTPGTLSEEDLLEARANNFIACLAVIGRDLGLAWLDMSTGDFHVQALLGRDLAAALARLAPSELLINERLRTNDEVMRALTLWSGAQEWLPAARFDSENARRRLERAYNVGSLDAFGAFSRAEVAAAGTLLDYVAQTQKISAPKLFPPEQVRPGSIMEIDPATQRNLELLRSLAGERAGSLLATIDRTQTGAGARLLAARLAAPLTDPAAIVDRQDTISHLINHRPLRSGLRDLLKGGPDIERAMGRLLLGRGGPRDLATLRDGLALAAKILGLINQEDPASLPRRFQHLKAKLGDHEELADALARALKLDVPLLARDGDFIAEGFSVRLDETLRLEKEGARLISNLAARYAKETGISSLKIKKNNVIGQFIEVTPLHADKLHNDQGPFIHRQTLAGAVRFTTVELNELVRKVASAEATRRGLEQEIFEEFVANIADRSTAIAETAQALAEFDLAAGLADLATEQNWCRPTMDSSTDFEVTAGRHPVVQSALDKSQVGSFVPNDCSLGQGSRIWLLTGPNMAGKSTFLRQNAVIAVLAQTGSYVPAERARIGIVDRLFSRVGAADDLAGGRSTFMVEMTESAQILNRASHRSLVILDEIGRGTATYDGLSIAWACIEYLHETNRCRTLFATHYHELTSLAAKLSELACRTMRVKEYEGEVRFLHAVAPGAADRSYGIHVARLAGLPKAAIARAEEVLSILEKDEQAGVLARLADDLPLFASARPRAPEPASCDRSAVEQRLAEVQPDTLTPRQALDLVYELTGLLDD